MYPGEFPLGGRSVGFSITMNWLNIEIKTIRCPEYVGSEPVDRATWINLLAYCAEQENGGRIESCRDWKDRRWQQTCGVTREEVLHDCDLWRWESNDLIIWEYPVAKENEVKSKRNGGKNGGIASGKSRSKASRQASIEAQLQASGEAQLQGELERKGKERNRKGIEKEENEKGTTLAQHNGASAKQHQDFLSEMAEIDQILDEPLMPRQAAGSMLKLEERVRGLKSDWKLPLTRAEQEDLMGCARAIQDLTDSDWAIIKAYLGARLPQGSPGWQPRSRAKFLQSAPDVWAHASEWHRKNHKPAKEGIWR